MRHLEYLVALFLGFACLSARSEVVINELMYHPGHAPETPEPVGEEYIELHNTDPANAVNLAGWSIGNGVGFTFPAATIPAGGYLVVCADPLMFATKYPAVAATVLGPWSGRLSNSGERVQLYDAAFTEIDDLTYSDEGDWAKRRRGPDDLGHRGWVWESDADGLGGSLELNNPALTNKQGQNWDASAIGAETPGGANTAASSNIAPLVREVKHAPAIPSSSDFVTVTARLTDEQAAGLTATVYYRVADLSPGAFNSIAMADNALNGDGDAGDGVFGVTLPAFPDGTVVEFYVEASDALAQTRTWPGPTDDTGTQGANALYQIEDAPPAAVNGLPVYRLILSGEEDDEFAFSNFSEDSNAQMNTTFIAERGEDTDVRYLAGLRRRGASSRSDNPRTMRLNLAGDNPWAGETRMNLNSQYTYLQLIGQKIFASACLASATAKPVRLFMNGSDEAAGDDIDFGAYVHMEPQGNESVAHQFPNDSAGNLYRKRRPSTDLAYQNGVVTDYIADGWAKDTNGSAWDWSDLDGWLGALNDISNPNYLADLEAVMDVDQWLRWFAVNALLNNGETNPSTGTDDDYYLYSGVIDPRIKPVIHDLDTILSFGDSDANPDPTLTLFDMIENGSTIPVLETLMRHPQVVPRYHQQFRDLIAGPFSKANFDAFLDGCLTGWVSSSRRGQLKTFMDARRAYVLSQVDTALTATSSLGVVSGFPQSTSATTSLDGTFDLAEAAAVRVNGQLATVDFENGTWSLGAPVFNEVPVLTARAIWSYLDDGSDQGTAWRASAFDDSGWKTGAAELGYGDGNEVTEVLFGPDPDNANNNPDAKYITTYFRREVTIADPSAYDDFILRLKRDDGAVVYVNGVEVVRDELPAGAAYDTLALSAAGGTAEATFFPFTLPISAFSAGLNTIAVEVHQVASDNVDISFDLSLVGREQLSPGVVNLTPGINRVLVEALDGNGDVIEIETIDIWYDDGDTQSISGSLASDTTLSAAGGPYVISADLVVPAGVTLTIEPGTSLYFAQGTRLTVDGRLVADGSIYNRIRFSIDPGSGDRWDGVYFANTLENNRMTFLDQEFSTAASHSLEIDDARLWLENVQWSGTTETVLEISGPQVDVINCDFPSSSGSEVIHGASLSGADWFHLIGNVFQTSSGYNDIIDFSGGRRPGPIIYLIGNTFNGGTDDCLDLDGIDAHIEGNFFYNIHTDDPSRSSTSNAIATDGDAHITIVRNVFDNVDHALLLKNESDAIFENNVVRNATLGAISFREPLRPTVDAGSDVFCRANIFVDNTVTFRFPDHLRSTGVPPTITAHGNIMPADEHFYGTGNIEADPAFVDAANRDFRLLPGSHAIGSGLNGWDMGADIPQGASVSGEPSAITNQTGATLTVYMPGISGIESGSFTTEYRWRLNGGAWNGETDIATPITLTGLADGSYTVEVVGKDSAGFWQDFAEANVSRTWVVDSGYVAPVRLNEIMADSSAGVDWVELYNPRTAAVDIGGYSFTDGTGVYVFPVATMIGAGDYVQVDALTAGFGFDRGGETVSLSDTVGVIDSVNFGLQATDLTIGRFGFDGEWTLNKPTPLAMNERQGTGDPHGLSINELLAAATVVVCDDFIELYNPSTVPVALEGMHLTDNPGGNKTKYTIPPLSYIAADGFAVFDADENSTLGADHTNFRLDANAEWAALYADDLTEVDIVAFASQVDDVSWARIPDGSATITTLPVPTPGLTNGGGTGTTTEIPHDLVDLGDSWSYEDTGTDLGTAWSAPSYDDAAWPTGAGLLGFEGSSLPAPGLQTTFTDPDLNSPYISTYYFRKSFSFSGDPANTVLDLGTVVDDGVVVYLNGQEIYRSLVPSGQDYGTFTGDTVSNASLAGLFLVPASALVNGTNVLAAEVHQGNSGSSDIVFGLALEATETEFTPSTDMGYMNAVNLVAGLRITEVMFDPDDGTAYEFIELQNIGTEALDISGVRFTNGIDFVFPAMTSLAPGEFVVLVNDPVSFATKYPGVAVGGQYTGKLSNGGEELVLQLPEPFTGNIQKFTYNDNWYPLADGGGVSLEIIDPLGRVKFWDRKEAWRPGALQGTPGSRISLSSGNTQTVALPASATLNGEVLGAWTPTLTWSKVSGPAGEVISGTGDADPNVSFTLPGTYLFQLSGTDGGTTLTSQTSVAVDDNYPAWSARNSLTGGELDDDDCDGVVNLLEYAFDLDPNVPDIGMLPLTLSTSGLVEFGYTLLLRKPDLTYSVETAPDLAGWSSVVDSLVSATADAEERVYFIPPGLRGFVRLSVTR